MKSRASALLLFMVSFLIAGHLAVSSWDGTYYLLIGDSRSPAAIKNPGIGLRLSKNQFLAASRRQLVSDLRFIQRQDLVGIQLGQMIVKGSEGRYQTACDLYDRVILTLEAEDVLESGRRPRMHIETLCVSTPDFKRLETIWLPKNSLLKQAANGEPLQIWEEDNPLTVKFSDLGQIWPQFWRLSDVELYHSQSKEKTIWQKEELLSLKTAQELTVKIF